MLENIFEFKIKNSDKPVDVIGLNKQTQVAYIWNLLRAQNRSILLVTNTLYEANNLYKKFVTVTEDVFLFPMDDFLVSEAIAISPDLMAKRLETLNEIVFSKQKKRLIITNLMGYLRFLPDVNLWNKLKLNLSSNITINRDELINQLLMMGYKKESLVTKTGEFANRGYILDIFPYGEDDPVRIEFFDNEIENIRSFNSETQLSIEDKKNIDILPFTEFINEKNVNDIPERQSLLGRVTDKLSSIKDYINNPIVIYDDYSSIIASYKNLMNEVTEFKETDTFVVDKYMHEFSEILPNVYINISLIDNYLFNSNHIVEKYSTASIDLFKGNFSMINNFLKTMLDEKKNITIFLKNDIQVKEFMSKVPYRCTLVNSAKSESESNIKIVIDQMPNGFIINNNCYLTSNEIFKNNETYLYKTKFRYGSKIKDVNKLKIGDYVVHQMHGIGKYLGIVTLTLKGMKKDYLHLEYKDNDKLYIPVEKIELISKYSSNEGAKPKINKLGGTEWAKQKARVKGKVKNIAKELLELSAKRKMINGFSFFPDDEDQVIFENKFPYEETKDQLKAINEIKEDMEESHPMDRLLCGDVGYGKTEVAFRAIFKAVKSGKQVAFLCPTTILSKQHYSNAIERFDGFGINIAVLNRFNTTKQKEEILKNLKSGKIDLIIGTHRLFGKDVIYKDLGLLIVDEEQRFGVTHKEKIKKYKESIDVLTLSATPIPRTLQMSLAGVRGLSLIETPPAYRYPVQTYVLKENNQVIRDAIYKELSRNGQVFVLYNNVTKIEEQVTKIKKLVPEASVTYIHGRMNKEEIERTMEKFINKDHNVLVCTTIIETGIDIENANTLIVLNADYFGLSQLYQIRGRIGRGKNIAYAYLMYDKNKQLNEVAVKRLDAIKEFTELGSGYALAVRDLAIRGAGDILGSEQSGFIDTIGYEMYLRILNEEVEKLRGRKKEEDENPDERPFIEVSTHISDKYAEKDDLKIEIHKKINMITNYESFELIKKELTDRFGTLDEEVIIYMLEELFQTRAKKAGIFKVDQSMDKITLYFNKITSEKADGEKLLSEIFKIDPSIDIKYLNNILRIVLTPRRLEKHFMYYLIKILDIFE